MSFDTVEIQQLNTILTEHFTDQHKLIMSETQQLLAEVLTKQRQEIRAEMHYYFNQQRSGIMLDVRSIMRQEFEPVVERLDKLIQRNSEDITGAYEDIGKLKKRVTRLEKRHAT